MVPRWVPWLLAVAPLPALALASHAMADWAARRGASAIDRAAKSITSPRDRGPEWVYLEPLGVDEAPEAQLADGVSSGSTKQVIARPSRVVPKKGIRVRAEAVLRLANAGARPSGIPVAAHGRRPAGLALIGVSGLGIGLVDGDVLTHAGGRPALVPGDVIGMVIGARAHHASEICGRFWRNGEPWNLIVEQPYVERSRRGPAARRSGS